MQGQRLNPWLFHIPLHGLSIMLLNGLVTGVHSSADNIMARATQYSVDSRASPKGEKKSVSPPSGRLALVRAHSRIWEMCILKM